MPPKRPNPLALFLFIMLLLATYTLASHAAGVNAPDAGTLIQENAPAPSAPPVKRDDELKLQPPTVPIAAQSAPFLVKHFYISGNTRFNTATLQQLIQDAEGKSLTLTEVDAVAARITAYYRERGFLLSRALVPPQTIENGEVRIQVLEARLGEVTINNKSQVSDALIRATAAGLKAGDEVEQSTLNRTLLLLGDMPGVRSSGSLRPGDAVGTSDLLLDLQTESSLLGRVSLDNFGNRYTGKARLGGQLYWLNPLKHGDYLQLGVMSSRDMYFGHVRYDYLLNGLGTRISGGYSSLYYRLGDDVSQLDANGRAEGFNLNIKHPLIRSTQLNLYTQLELERMSLRDHIDAAATKTDRHLNNAMLSVEGNVLDGWFASSANNQWRLQWTHGQVKFDDATAELFDGLTADTQGAYDKINLHLSRAQQLDARHTLAVSLAGQWTDDNLDSSQKMLLGGANSMQAYSSSALSGDIGYLAKLELRRELGYAFGQWRGALFYEKGYVQVNADQFAAGRNSASVSDAGVALYWQGAHELSASAYVATTVGNEPTLANDTGSARAWLEFGLAF